MKHHPTHQAKGKEKPAMKKGLEATLKIPKTPPPLDEHGKYPTIDAEKSRKKEEPREKEKEENTVPKKNWKERMRERFSRQNQAKKPAKDMPKKKPGRRHLQRRSLQEYLDKAGYSADASNVKRNVFKSTIVLFGILTVIVLVLAGQWGAEALDTLIFLMGLWTAVFLFGLLVAMAGVFFFLDYRIYQRTKELEEVLPDFLQLASANIAAGMPIDRALWYAIRPNFGVLAKEMEEVAKATMAGEDLEQSLMKFSDRYESTTLKRSISILIEGLRAGGEMADLLNKIALNIDELKIMKKEMAANVTTYAIFITFASIIIAPFLFALATQLLIIIIKITGSLDLTSTSSMFTFGSADPKIVSNFKLFSILMLFVSTIFSSSIVSVIKNGNVISGIKSIPVYALVAVAVYYFSVIFLGGLFGNII